MRVYSGGGLWRSVEKKSRSDLPGRDRVSVQPRKICCEVLLALAEFRSCRGYIRNGRETAGSESAHELKRYTLKVVASLFSFLHRFVGGRLA